MEGLEATLFGPPERLAFYKRFPGLRGRLVEYRGDSDLDALAESGHILVPSGSIVEYIGHEETERTRLPIFGLRGIVKWESRWDLKMRLLEEAGIPTPRVYRRCEEISGPVIVKLPGAKGGAGYLLSDSPGEVSSWIGRLIESRRISSPDEVCIQQYIVGTPMYAHFFQSPIMGRLELTGFDIRYESNIDGLRRLPPKLSIEASPSFTVAGNLPLYPRESLLETFIRYGERFVEATRRLIPPGIIGPFSLESIVTDSLEPVVFEFSGRIVAGTNVYMSGSPYLALYWGEEISVGRRVAREVRMAHEEGRMKEVIT